MARKEYSNWETKLVAPVAHGQNGYHACSPIIQGNESTAKGGLEKVAGEMAIVEVNGNSPLGFPVLKNPYGKYFVKVNDPDRGKSLPPMSFEVLVKMFQKQSGEEVKVKHVKYLGKNRKIIRTYFSGTPENL